MPSHGPWRIGPFFSVFGSFQDCDHQILPGFPFSSGGKTWNSSYEEHIGNVLLVVSAANCFFYLSGLLGISPLLLAERSAYTDFLMYLLDAAGIGRIGSAVEMRMTPHSAGPWLRSIPGAVYGERSWSGARNPLIVPVYLHLAELQGLTRIQQQLNTRYIQASCNAFFRVAKNYGVSPVALSRRCARDIRKGSEALSIREWWKAGLGERKASAFFEER